MANEAADLLCLLALWGALLAALLRLLWSLPFGPAPAPFYGPALRYPAPAHSHPLPPPSKALDPKPDPPTAPAPPTIEVPIIIYRSTGEIIYLVGELLSPVPGL